MDTGSVTLINVFEIEPDKLESFLAGWRERATLMSKQPGFRSLRLHRALSPDFRFQLVNVAQWQTADALHAATAQERFIEGVRRAGDETGVTAHPGLYQVAVEITAPPTKRIRPPLWLKVFNKVYSRISRVGVSFGAEGPRGADRARPQVGKATLDAGHAVNRRWRAVCGPRGSRLGLGGQCPRRGGGHASARAPHRTRPHGGARRQRRSPGLREYPIQVPTGVGFVKKAGLVKDGTPDEFEELAGRCAVFRLDPRA